MFLVGTVRRTATRVSSCFRLGGSDRRCFSDGEWTVGTIKKVAGAKRADGDYHGFLSSVQKIIPENRIHTDPLVRLTFSTDASYFRMLPEVVVKVRSEEEVKAVLPLAKKYNTPVTFRAGGTSLSGQAVTDSVLMKLGAGGWRRYQISPDGMEMKVEPGMILGECNSLLKSYGRKLGPDPSSIDSCWIGGVVANNSSGMCCGVHHNTYHTMKDLRIVFANGAVLDTADESSWERFSKENSSLVQKVLQIANRVKSDDQLRTRIQEKFRIKCTTGYSINALIDFDCPKEIIKHLMVGSEGTLGFVSNVTYHTVPDHEFKCSAFILFDTIEDACSAAKALREAGTADAVELFDKSSLRSCQRREDLAPLELHKLGPEAAALLVESRGQDEMEMESRSARCTKAILEHGLSPTRDIRFTTDEAECTSYWNARKELIPMVGGDREKGTTLLIEDVAVPIVHLAPLCRDLLELFRRYEYDDAILLGHALEGNLHLMFTQRFRTQADVDRYALMFDELCQIVAGKYNGSLKGEHGTGRNVAPFVQLEWGERATAIMWELKRLFDPDGILNPGVLLNEDPEVHVQNIKLMPPANEIVDRCIECGFCESACPSRDVTMTPRQRIVAYRELTRMKETGEEPQLFKSMTKSFEYAGNATCAADGMCGTKCPLQINTGALVKQLRTEELEHSPLTQRFATLLASNYGTLTRVLPFALDGAHILRKVLGQTLWNRITQRMHQRTGKRVPLWNDSIPHGAPVMVYPRESRDSEKETVVYFPSCVSRVMGNADGDGTADTRKVFIGLLERAGYNVVVPRGIDPLCCGLVFSSRGLASHAESMSTTLEKALVDATDNGKLSVICDTSPCVGSMREHFASLALRFQVYEPLEFASRFLLNRLDIQKTNDPVLMHIPCSSKRMGVTNHATKVLNACSSNVTWSGVPCCGMAGDRGLRYPELTAGALMHMNVPADCSGGYSTSRTCEIGLSERSGVPFRSVIHLLDACSSQSDER